MSPAERVIRTVGYVAVGFFLAFIFLPIVGFALYNALVRERAKAVAFLAEPGLWIIAAGPVLLWTSLVLMYFRLPREVRSVNVGTFGRNDLRIGRLMAMLRQYRHIHGFDWVLWAMSLSALVTAVLLMALAVS